MYSIINIKYGENINIYLITINMKDWNYLFKGEYYQTEWNKELQGHAIYKWYM